MREQTYMRKVNRGTISKMCRHCGKPMQVARGCAIQEVNEKGNVLNQTVNNDQRALYHGKCRKEGRRLEYKSNKKLSKMK